MRHQSLPDKAGCLLVALQVTALSFSTKGNVLATAGKDGLVMLWDTRHNLLHSKPMPRVRSRPVRCMTDSMFCKLHDAGHPVIES